MNTHDRIADATIAIRAKSALVPRIGIILGTGLGSLSRKIRLDAAIPYRDIPGFLVSTAPGHAGMLLLGKIGAKPVVVMEGRFHPYEGYCVKDITFPVRVMKALGVKTLVVSNACGGMNPLFEAGDIAVIEDHINLMGVNPLAGPNDERLGPRFPDMCEPYDKKLIALAEKTALAIGMRLHKGVYVGVPGPNLETRAEYRFLRGIGADMVGMSTVPEVLVAVHAGLKVLGLSVVTDRCLPDALEPVDIRKILKTAATAEPKLTRLVEAIVRKIP
ncbi:MAG: purine-nucleoside phosphorylase [Planctomycetota bacterium]